MHHAQTFVAVPGTSVLLDLARSIERCTATDPERARAEAQSLQLIVEAHAQQASAALKGGSADEVWTAAKRLLAVLEHIVFDLAGGHVTAISGLKHQVRRYLEHASTPACSGIR